MKKYRREFIKAGLSWGVVAAAGSPQVLGSVVAKGENLPSSRVVIARDEKLCTGSTVSERRLLEILDRSIQTYFNRDNPLEAWRLVAKPGQVVGLKVNCLAGRGISTNPSLIEAIGERLQQVGVGASDIVIWDRLNRDLERGGFAIREQGKKPRCFGNDHLGYGQQLETFSAAGSLLCRTLTEVCDVVINLPVLKDHGITGMTMAMKNLFGAIHNPNKYHLNAGDPYVADVYMLPPIRQKIKLTICDAITAQYEGGPSFMPHWTWLFNGLIVGADPVALDHTGWQILE